LRTARFLIAVTLPLGALGALAAPRVPEQALRLGYGAAMVTLAGAMVMELRRRTTAEVPVPLRGRSTAGGPSAGYAQPCGGRRTIAARDGCQYDFTPRGLPLQRVFSGLGAISAGLISTGVGEATMPLLVRRCRFPLPVAAATSTLVVAGTVVGAAATHAAQLVAEGGFTAVP
jgi:uncharacterized membrane protein YfcA